MPADQRSVQAAVRRETGAGSGGVNADEQTNPERAADSAIWQDDMPSASLLRETQFRALTLLNNELMSLTTIAQLLMLEQVHFIPNGPHGIAQIIE
jgi:hypothetical protein